MLDFQRNHEIFLCEIFLLYGSVLHTMLDTYKVVKLLWVEVDQCGPTKAVPKVVSLTSADTLVVLQECGVSVCTCMHVAEAETWVHGLSPGVMSASNTVVPIPKYCSLVVVMPHTCILTPSKGYIYCTHHMKVKQVWVWGVTSLLVYFVVTLLS